MPPRFVLIGALVVLSGVLHEIGYSRWWVAIFVTPLPLAFAFTLCGSRKSCLFLGLVGSFVVFRIQQDSLTVFVEVAANLLFFISALTMIPAAMAIHEGVRRRWRMAWVLPVAWVGAEALRLAGPLGLPFAVLGFACHEQTWMIQIADLGGPLLLSFAIAAANGVLLDALLARGSIRQRLCHAMIPGGFVVVVAWLALLAYGRWRVGQVEGALEPGLRVAVLQADALLFANVSKNYDGHILLEDLMRLSEAAARAPEPPDLIVWPEKAADIPLYNQEFLQAPFHPNMLPVEMRQQAQAHHAMFAPQWERAQAEHHRQMESFLKWVDDLGIPVLAGLTHQRISGSGFPHYFETLNAGTLFVPTATSSATPVASQFKIRLFPGGEYMPGGLELWRAWADWFPPVRRWIESTPTITPGEQRVLMQLKNHPFIVAICSEILHSDSAGVFEEWTDGSNPLIMTMANEGRFHRSNSILISKMAMAFRAVEARTSVARATNAGISGFTDPVGRYHGFVTNADGRYFTRLGAPDAVAIDAVLAWQSAHGNAAMAADPVLRAEHQRRVAEVLRLRSLAGIEGFSVRNTSTTSLQTVYQQGGHLFPWAIVTALGLLLASTIWRKSNPEHPNANPPSP